MQCTIPNLTLCYLFIFYSSVYQFIYGLNQLICQICYVFLCVQCTIPNLTLCYLFIFYSSVYQFIYGLNMYLHRITFIQPLQHVTHFLPKLTCNCDFLRIIFVYFIKATFGNDVKFGPYDFNDYRKIEYHTMIKQTVHGSLGCQETVQNYLKVTSMSYKVNK